MNEPKFISCALSPKCNISHFKLPQGQIHISGAGEHKGRRGHWLCWN